MSEKDVKALKDYSSEVKETIPKLEKQAKEDPQSIPDVLAQFLALEKKTRLAADAPSTTQVVTALLDLLFFLKLYNELNDHILILAKRRAQLQKVIEIIVKHPMTFLEKLPSDDEKRKLIQTLRTVSDGKLVVELERARLTKMLTEMLEKEGKYAEATELLQEVQIETVGSMESREKAEFLLEQIRLCLQQKDYIRTEIIAKKVDLKQLEDPKLADVKIRFYKLQISYHLKYNNYAAIAQAWHAIYNTETVQKDESQCKEALTNLVIFACLTEFDSEASDLLHRLSLDKNLNALPHIKAVLLQLISHEIMAWPLTHASQWKSEAAFDDEDKTMEDRSPKTKSPAKPLNTRTTFEQLNRWDVLHKRVLQHNIRVVSEYYARIRIARLAEMLGVSNDETELLLSEMISNKQLIAKIDRPFQIVTFAKQNELAQKPKSVNGVATEKSNDKKKIDESAEKTLSNDQTLEPIQSFTADIGKLLTLIDQTTHLIQRENMVHNID